MSEAIRMPEPECAQSRAWMAQFVDGELAEGRSAWLAAHLERCAECRAALAGFAEIDEALAAWGRNLDRRNPAPAGAREELEANLRSLSARRRTFLWIPAVAATVAAGVALVAIAPRKLPPPVLSEASQFVAIPYLPPLDPRENTTVVRMNIRVAALMEAGYQITADPDAVVVADVLVREGGQPYAVRVLSGIDWDLKGD